MPERIFFAGGAPLFAISSLCPSSPSPSLKSVWEGGPSLRWYLRCYVSGGLSGFLDKCCGGTAGIFTWHQDFLFLGRGRSKELNFQWFWTGNCFQAQEDLYCNLLCQKEGTHNTLFWLSIVGSLYVCVVGNVFVLLGECISFWKYVDITLCRFCTAEWTASVMSEGRTHKTLGAGFPSQEWWNFVVAHQILQNQTKTSKYLTEI